MRARDNRDSDAGGNILVSARMATYDYGLAGNRQRSSVEPRPGNPSQPRIPAMNAIHRPGNRPDMSATEGCTKLLPFPSFHRGICRGDFERGGVFILVMRNRSLIACKCKRYAYGETKYGKAEGGAWGILHGLILCAIGMRHNIPKEHVR